MIYTENLTKFFHDLCAVDHISFEVKKGEILGLLGPNGAGKTTTLRMLTCFLAPTSGIARIKDIDVSENPFEVKKLIGYLPESAPLYQDMIVYDYLDYIADLRDIEKGRKKSRIAELSEICGIDTVMHKPVSELSKGFKQRVGLAHAMIGDPEILVFDEPTSGLDPNQIIEIRNLIKRLGQEKTVIFSSHILSEVEATCDRIVIINKGRIAVDGSINNLRNSAGGSSVVDIRLTGADSTALKSNLEKINGVKTVTILKEDGGVLFVRVEYPSSEDVIPGIYSVIKNSSADLLEFTREKKTLETIFSQITTEQ